MEVSNNLDASTAVIGVKVNHAAQIDASPEFFNVLSSSMYKYQELAMVRETITNAWDAHIEAGKTDTPIEVRIDEDNCLCIKDFGLGIPDDLINEVYLTYGKGTKVNCEKSTGGFGLGCKSPWAYTDAFEVISEHNGIKTVYSMLKSSRLFDGKPGCVTVVGDIPTEDTGVTVRIPLNQGDDYTVGRLVAQVVRTGSIPCMYQKGNAEPVLLSVLDMGYEKGACAFVPNFQRDFNQLSHLRDTQILLRYANVVYPLPTGEGHTAFQHVVGELGKLVHKINQECTYGGTLLIQLAPNSVTLQPSREGISETDYSLDSIAAQLNDALGQWIVDFNEGITSAKAKQLDMLASTSVDAEGKAKCPNPDYAEAFDSMKAITSFSELGYLVGASSKLERDDLNKAVLSMLDNWQKGNKLITDNQFKILRKLVESRKVRAALVGNSKFTRLTLNAAYVNDVPVELKKLRYDIISTKLKDVLLNEELMKKLNINFRHNELIDGIKHVVYGHRDPLFYSDFIRGINHISNKDIVLTTNKSTARDRCYARTSKLFSNVLSIYLSTPTKKEKENARELINSTLVPKGWTFTDLTVWTEDDIHLKPEPKKRNTTKSVAEKVQETKERETLPALSTLLRENEDDNPYSIVPHTYLNKCTDYPVKYVQNPEFVVVITSKIDRLHHCMDGVCSHKLALDLLVKHGHRIGICKSITQYKSWLKKGAKPVLSLVVEEAEAKLAEYEQDKKVLTEKYPNSYEMLYKMLNNFGGYINRDYYSLTQEEYDVVYTFDYSSRVIKLVRDNQRSFIRLNETSGCKDKINEYFSKFDVLHDTFDGMDKYKELCDKLSLVLESLKNIKPSAKVHDFAIKTAKYGNWFLYPTSTKTKDDDTDLVKKIRQLVIKDFKEYMK